MQTFCVRFPFRGFFISKNFYLSDNPMEFREILVTAFCQRLNAINIHASMIPAINFFAFLIRIPPLICVLILCNSFYVLSYHSL